MTVVPVGVDHTVFRPLESDHPVPGRIMVDRQLATSP